jgi:hypothetical protein
MVLSLGFDCMSTGCSSSELTHESHLGSRREGDLGSLTWHRLGHADATSASP